MRKEDLMHQAKGYFLPLILGNTPEARRLARRLFKKFGIRPFILDEEHSWKSFFSLSYYLSPLCRTESTRLLLEQLEDIARQYPGTLPILVPTTAKYREAINGHREAMERIFVIKEPSALLSEAPFSRIK
jgi:hypothetical protein